MSARVFPLLLIACASPPRSALDPPPPPPSPPLATGPIAIDGVLDEPAWATAAARAELRSGDVATEIRLLREPTAIVVAIDARTRALASADAIEVALGDAPPLRLAPTGAVPAGAARVVVGTVDDPVDDDVGARYELRVAIAALGAAPPFAVAVSRCAPTCATWRGSIEPIPSAGPSAP